MTNRRYWSLFLQGMCYRTLVALRFALMMTALQISSRVTLGNHPKAATCYHLKNGHSA